MFFFEASPPSRLYLVPICTSPDFCCIHGFVRIAILLSKGIIVRLVSLLPAADPLVLTAADMLGDQWTGGQRQAMILYRNVNALSPARQSYRLDFQFWREVFALLCHSGDVSF